MEGAGLKSRLWRFCLTIVGIAAFVAIGIALEDEVGIPFATTYRVACAGACLFLVARVGWEYREEQWPWIAFSAALLADIALFFTPLVDRPPSRGEAMLFALPDTIILLAARIASYRVTDDHQRAVRQQLILGLILAVALCAILFPLALIEPRTAR